MKLDSKIQHIIDEILSDESFKNKIEDFKNNSFFDLLGEMRLMMEQKEKRDLTTFRFSYSIIYKAFSTLLKDYKKARIQSISKDQFAELITIEEFIATLLLSTDYGDEHFHKIDKETFNNRLIEMPSISKKAGDLKSAFIKDTGYSKEISNVDFLGVLLMTPALSIAMADGVIDYFENRYLSIKAREHSAGKYLPFMDPVVNMVEFLAQHLEKWERPFLEMNRFILDELVSKKSDLQRNPLFKASFPSVFDGPKKLVNKKFDSLFEELLNLAEKAIYLNEFGEEMKNVSIPDSQSVMKSFQYWGLTMESMKWDLSGLALPYFIGESIIRSLFFRKNELSQVERDKVSEIIDILGFKFE
ncbi:MAG: hypothetical protein OEY59_08160 [Deltaproteobacteria bacterium]|nr:hypothetical protein [Deltaproteobacteria bacterium]